MQREPNCSPETADLRQRAEERLKTQGSENQPQRVETDAQRVIHELHVHQIELEMQNDELRRSRNEMEALLEKYTDLYDFAPTGYFSMDQRGCILEVNLTGAALLGVNRAELISQCLPRFVAQESRPVFLSFLEQVFTRSKRQSCEITLVRANGTAFWTALHGTASFSLNDPQQWCRVSVSDITAIKQAEEAQRHLNVMADANQVLQGEIIHRRAAEEKLRQSEQQARFLMEQLRHLSHRILSVQEEERKRISRELHDEITQTLIGINVQ
ncbi:MAG: PAS domain S-box protein, partial [Kiritimatiellales bacterium]|nr:PAS domain S-box protein [Kiritimatiellales bacterium]